MALHTARPLATALLDGIWDFAWLGDADLSPTAIERGAPLDGVAFRRRAAVPGCFDTLPDLAGARGTAAYRTTFVQGEEPVGELRFDGLGVWAAVYLDGSLVRVHRKPYSPFSVEVPGSSATTRELVVLVDNRFDVDRSPLQENYFDFYAYGGVFRSVAYTPLPAVHITGVRVTTASVDPPAADVAVHATADEHVELAYLVDGVEVSRADSDAGNALGAARRIALPSCGAWTPDRPEMHTLTVRMTAGSSRDEYSVRFGLRTLEVDGPRLLLNGEPIRLFGWNRHEAHPQFGPALPEQLLLHDIQIMKAAGANFVRGSHYPQDDRFLDLCDETGMLVWEESIGWQQDERHFANDEYGQLVTEQQIDMVEAHANHPSIILWGFQNELHSELDSARPLLENLATVTRSADPTRPITFATCRFPDDRCLDLVDVVSINTYPGWYASDAEDYRPLGEIAARLNAMRADLERQGLDEKPLVISEIGAGAIYGWRDPHAGHWSEEYQSDYLAEICSQFLAREEIAGLALWQFSDCRTYGSARAIGRPRGFNNKGIVDEYRRPKLAYATVRALMT